MTKLLIAAALGLVTTSAQAFADYDLAPIKAKVDVATVQIVTREDPFGHKRKSACGSYVVYAPSGARIGLQQFVFTGGELIRQGEAQFSGAWEQNCTQW